jgi:hypothetical protein
MGQFSHLTDAEIEKRLQEVGSALRAERQYVDNLVQGNGRPRDPLARSQAIETHRKAIAVLEKDMEDLLAARAKH